MNNTFNFLAFDLGATSGRSILGTFDNGKLELRELTRFGNDILQIQGKQLHKGRHASSIVFGYSY